MDFDLLHDMPRYILASLSLVFILALFTLSLPVAAQNASGVNETANINGNSSLNVSPDLRASPSVVVNQSTAVNITPAVNVSPVTIQSGSNTSMSIEDSHGINYSVYDSIYGTSPHVSIITVQLYLNGAPYDHPGIPITFTSDNDSVAVLEPLNRTKLTDAHGRAKILLIANNTVGAVNIIARSQISHSIELKDACTVQIVGWGTVSGMVTDKNKNGVPFANVTLWVWDGSNVGVLQAPDNPQLTNDGSTAAIGTFTFTYVPHGTYNLTAEKDGHVYFAMVYMDIGTYTANVAFPDYAVPAFIMPTPTPAPTPETIASPTPSPTATPSSGLPIPGMEIVMATISIALAAAASLHKKI